MMKILIVALLTLVAIKSYAQHRQSIDSTNIHIAAEPMPAYPGGMEALVRFLQKNMKLPKEAHGAEGTVYIGFIVNEDGVLSDFKVVQGLSDAIDKRVLETFMKMPKWVPGRRDNKPIKTKMVLPYTIHLSY